MNGGRFDTPLAIYRYSENVNSDTGERSKVWTKLSDIWGTYEPTDGGTEGIHADTRENKQIVKFQIRFTDITVRDRIQLDGVNYNVISIQLIERNMYMKVMTQLTE
jgi:SPP1 family predicted phage head-tail adaptor